MNSIALSLPEAPWVLGVGGIAVVVLLICLPRLLGIVYIPHTQVGIIEKIWSGKGSLREGQIIARNSEAGFQARFLRGGIHFGLYPWQYRIHKEPLVAVAEGKMAYVYARDGVPLEPIQTLGRTVESNHFQDAVRFLEAQGQRGRQRGILREGVYAINLALFVIITEDRVFSGPVRESADRYESWKAQLAGMRAFDPVVIGAGGHSHFRANLADRRTRSQLLPGPGSEIADSFCFHRRLLLNSAVEIASLVLGLFRGFVRGHSRRRGG